MEGQRLYSIAFTKNENDKIKPSNQAYFLFFYFLFIKIKFHNNITLRGIYTQNE